MYAGKSRYSNAYTHINRVKLIRGGKEYFDCLLKCINEAKEFIHLQTYIYDDDITGLLVADALKAACKRNVTVYLMTDGYASQVMSRSFIKDLKQEGIHFRFFEPLFKSRHFYFGRRMHHKVAVFDGRYALAGGVNIADRYNDLPGKPAWLDFAVYVEGEVAKELCVLCWKTWHGYPRNMGLTPCEQQPFMFDIPKDECSQVSMRRNDWVRRKSEISGSYIKMFRTARSEITILCSYFLPGKIIRKQILFALQKGVRIRVIAAGRSDVMLAKNAERWLYDWLLRNNIELYEYEKTVLHGKLAVCEDQWMTIGSYNVNDISAFASIELNLDIRNPEFVQHARHEIDEIIKNDCTRITRVSLAKTTNVFKQLLRWFSFQFIRDVFHLFTFYFKKGR